MDFLTAYVKYQEALVTHSKILFSTLIVPLVLVSYVSQVLEVISKMEGLT